MSAVAPCGGVCDAVGDESELLATCDEDEDKDEDDDVGGELAWRVQMTPTPPHAASVVAFLRD